MITAGEVLKNKRELLKKSLERVSADTKIQKRFLGYIEENKFEYFDSEVFLTGFIKIYANYLDLDTDKVLALYRRSNPNKTPRENTNKKEDLKPSKKLKKKATLEPKLLITILLGIFLLTIFAYIGFQIYKFQRPPSLEIISPVPDSIIQTEKISVEGQTDSESIIEVNGTAVETNEQGEFTYEVTLKEGLNTITIKARKNNALEKIETINVTYTIDTQAEEEKQEEVTENTIRLEVFDSPAWVRLDIDGENKISQVLEPTKEEFVIKETLYIITGRIKNTRLYFNDNPLEWQTNQTTGIAELTCQVEEGELSCQ
ncbi:MAG TPA: helix-turn-helix domain-containing protein [Candidatus Dojkabacteria bacterium]|nr:helix-turn-helix domain-containing protein [Candidatus Dojkabacteria bacterium]